MGLRAKLSIGMFIVLVVSVGLVAGQAVLLFQQDKSSYVFEMNATQAIRIADEIQNNVRHLEEKMRIFSSAIQLKAPAGVDQRQILGSMLQQYPEFILFSTRAADGTLREIFQSQALTNAGLTIESVHERYSEGLPFDAMTGDRPFLKVLGLSDKLPTFTLALAPLLEEDGKPGPILIAECPLHRLFASGGESSLYEVYVIDSAGVPILAHGGSAEYGVAAEKSARFSGILPESATTAGTREYVVSGVPMLGAYAPVGNLGLWTLVQIPKAHAFEAARRLFNRSLFIALVVCIASLGLVLVVASSITRPLVALTRATEQIGQGQFDVKMPKFGGDEIGALGERFVKMTEELGTREKALQDANVRLVESEKMTALGQLGAGIAHEVKNPLTSIRGYAQMGLRKMKPEDPFFEYFQTIEKETGRSLEILKNLLKFSRQETAEMSCIDINLVVTDTVKLVTHQLSMKGVEISATLAPGELRVIGNANQIEQVLLNLFMNAGDAMENGGTVVATTEESLGNARIEVIDNGAGIPPHVIKRIFNPFFTTKPVGQGTGLGLSVSYGIIKDHKGEITVESEPGKGTRFIIQIPISDAETEALPRAAAGGAKQPRVISLR